MDPNGDPDTMMGDGTVSQDVVKLKKKKLTAAEKEKAKLDKESDVLLRNASLFEDFLSRFELWWKHDGNQCVQIFNEFDSSEEGVISCNEFRAAVLDLGAPLSKVELHLLCKMLDTDETEEIDYDDIDLFVKDTRIQRNKSHPSMLRPALQLTKRPPLKCKSCKIPIWDGESYVQDFPEYVQIHFKLITFDNVKKHPAHFKRVASTNTLVLQLLNIIREETALLSPPSLHQLVLFRDKTYSETSMLSENKTLEQLGFEGGTRERPDKIDLFYDFKIEFSDCPILLCDHYFGKKIPTATNVL